MASGFPGFAPEALKFLEQLKRNNNRNWFLKHKETYERKLKEPMIELVLALGDAMQSFAPELVTDPKRAIYRFYRDIRFSADKSPYKTHVAAIFVLRGVPKHSGAAMYFHVSPDEVVIAGGVYMPQPDALRSIRSHIAAHWEELGAILRQRTFKKICGSLQGDQLARAPKGFAPDHPAIDLLRRKQYYVSLVESPSLALTPSLFPRLLNAFGVMMPLIRFLNAPLQRPSGRAFAVANRRGRDLQADLPD
jgi:uncharacterized protein (TIGR02453 family)